MGYLTQRLGQLLRPRRVLWVRAVTDEVAIARSGVLDRGRSDQDRDRPSTMSIGRVGGDVADIAAQRLGDLVGGAAEGRLQIVASQHDHDGVEGEVAQEAGHEVGPTIEAGAVCFEEVMSISNPTLSHGSVMAVTLAP